MNNTKIKNKKLKVKKLKNIPYATKKITQTFKISNFSQNSHLILVFLNKEFEVEKLERTFHFKTQHNHQDNILSKIQFFFIKELKIKKHSIKKSKKSPKIKFQSKLSTILSNKEFQKKKHFI